MMMAVLWVRSYTTASDLRGQHTGWGYFDLWSRAGALRLDWVRDDTCVGDRWLFDASYPVAVFAHLPDASQDIFFGFTVETTGSLSEGFLRLPHWFFVFLLGIAPVMAVIRLAKKHQSM